MLNIAGVNQSLDILNKIKNAFTSLRASSLFIPEMAISDLVEKYFSFELLPNEKIKLTGVLSPYIPNSQFPVYSPLDNKGTSHEREVSKTTPNTIEGKIGTTISALNVPAIKLNPVTLNDGSTARILWLYPVDTNGLLFPKSAQRVGLMAQNTDKIFSVDNSMKPLPVLLDTDTPTEPLLYKAVTITGRVTTAPRQHFDILSSAANAFQLNFFSNCIRPFSDVDGVLAIDARKPHFKIDIKDTASRRFNIVYTVQGIVEIDKELTEKDTDILLSKLVDFIPDRQGLPKDYKTLLDSRESRIGSIITIGDISWQYSAPSKCFASYILTDVANSSSYQSKIAQLAHHWQLWQKAVGEYTSPDFGAKTNCGTLILSNNTHDKTFSRNGLQIPLSLERALLSGNPEIRAGIDWLGISVGR